MKPMFALDIKSNLLTDDGQVNTAIPAVAPTNIQKRKINKYSVIIVKTRVATMCFRFIDQ